MKKIVSIILVAVISISALSFSGCAPKNKEGQTPLGISLYLFDMYVNNYTTDGEHTEADNLEEFEDVLAEGYVNEVFLTKPLIMAEQIELCRKYNVKFWVYGSLWDSEREEIEDYINSRQTVVNIIKKCDAWDIFQGWHWDEPILNGATNEEFYEMTKTLYEKWGKRNYPVFAIEAFVDDYWPSPEDRRCDFLENEFTTYITDAGWDAYGTDVREEAMDDPDHVASLKKSSEKYGKEFKTGGDVYRFITEEMLEKFDHDVNVWFYPCAYITGCTTGTTDEDYCLGHLNFFNELLKEQKNPGGLALYYYGGYTANVLSQYLPVKNLKTGKQKMFPDVPKWESYAKRVKEIKKEFDKTLVTPAMDIPFGSFDIEELTDIEIKYYAVKGYEYSIDGKNFENDGVFDSLTAETEYTVTIRRISDNKTGTLKVKTEEDMSWTR